MERKIRILQLIESMNDGGAQRVVLNYLKSFNDDPDIEMKLLVYHDLSDSFCNRIINEKKYNVDYLFKNLHNRYIRKIVEILLGKILLVKYIKKFKPDIVHVHISPFLVICLKSIVKCKVPIKFDTLHSNPYRFTGKTLKYIKNAFEKYNFIGICLTNEQAKMAVDYYGIKKYEIVRNGIDINAIKKKIITKEQARKKLGLNNNSFVVGAVGRLNTIKRYDLLIKILKKILENNNNAYLVIAGDGPEKNNLYNIAKKLKIEERVKFLGNIDNTIDVYCAIDVFVMTSESEASPLVLVESQICGNRCVISDGVPSESIVTDHVIKMKRNASINDWCSAIIDEKKEGHKVLNIDEYDINIAAKNIKKVYLKYWKEYDENGNNKKSF